MESTNNGCDGPSQRYCSLTTSPAVPLVLAAGFRFIALAQGPDHDAFERFPQCLIERAHDRFHGIHMGGLDALERMRGDNGPLWQLHQLHVHTYPYLRRRGVNIDDVARWAQHGITGERKRGDIGFASLRGGNVIGDHTATFAIEDERLEISHKAQSRQIFARGAVHAALWSAGKEPGFYTMFDVLGIEY